MDNYGYEYEEDEISLKDAFFYILRHLKQMLIVGLVCLLLLGGYKGFKSFKDAKEQNELYANNEALAAERQKIVDDLDAKSQELSSYMAEFNVASNNAYVARATYFVDSGFKVNPNSTVQDIDYTDTLLAAYSVKLQDKSSLDKIAKKYDIEGNLSDYVTVNYSSHLLYVYAYNEDQKMALNILHDITSSIDSITEELVSSISSHTITFVSEDVYLDSEWVLNRQNARITSITNTLANIDSLKTSLNSLDTEIGSIVNPGKALFSDFIKFGLIGFVVGAILVCGYYFVLFLLKDSVYSADELKDKTDIRVLGNIATDKKVSKYISWINKVEKRVTSTDYNLIATSIETFSNGSSVLVIGDVKDRDVIESNLKSLIKDKTLIFTGLLDKDINALKALDKCNDVVLLAKCNESCYKSINGQKERLKDLNKNIVGCVVEE